MNHLFSAHGEIKIDMSKKINSKSEVNALRTAIELLNEYNVDIQEITFKTNKGDVTVDVHNVDIIWSNCFQEN